MNTPSRLRPQPLLWWALVLMLAMLSFYVHLLAGHVERGAQWRERFAASSAPAQRLAGEQRHARQPPSVTRTAQR